MKIDPKHYERAAADILSTPDDSDESLDLLAAEGMTETEDDIYYIDGVPIARRGTRNAYFEAQMEAAVDRLTVTSHTLPSGIVVREILRPASAPKIALLLEMALSEAGREKEEALKVWNLECMASHYDPFCDEVTQTELKKRYDLAARHEIAVRELVELYRRGGWGE